MTDLTVSHFFCQLFHRHTTFTGNVFHF